MFLLPAVAPKGAIWRRNEMRKVAWVALFLLALSTGAAYAQQPPAPNPHASWLAALVELWEAFFGATPTPPPHTNILDGDCGSFIDPTGGCRH